MNKGMILSGQRGKELIKHIPLHSCLYPPFAPVLVVINVSDCVFPGPFTRRGFVTTAICLVDMRDLWNQWIVWVGVRQHRANT